MQKQDAEKLLVGFAAAGAVIVGLWAFLQLF
jgi:hypothetical protein